MDETAHLHLQLEKPQSHRNSMKRTIDPIGKKYGKLLVLEEISAPIVSTQKYRASILKLKCLCDCGNIVTPFKGNVTTGKTTQCTNCQNSLITLGEKKGSLTVLSRILSEKCTKYLCRCDCGFEYPYSSRFLLHGKNICCKKCKSPKRFLPKKTRAQSLAITNFNKHLRTRNSVIGKKIGRLKIIAFSHWEQGEIRRRAYYKAKCKCGNVIIVRGCFEVKSCGCLQKDAVLKGEDITQARLTNSQAQAIREFKKSNLGYTNRQLADMFRVGESLISRILLNKSYKEKK